MARLEAVIFRVLVAGAALSLGSGAGMTQASAAAPAKAAWAKTLRFESVSIRAARANSHGYSFEFGSDRLRLKNVRLKTLMTLAYFGPANLWQGDWAKDRITGLPDWARKERFDIDAKVGSDDQYAWQQEGVGAARPMLQAMLRRALEERFGLVVHTTVVDGPAYVLMQGARGANVSVDQAWSVQPTWVAESLTGGSVASLNHGDVGQRRFYKTTMPEFAQFLSQSADRPVVDGTGLKGAYRFEVTRRTPVPNDPTPSVGWNLEQVGFRLAPGTAARKQLIVEKVEEPTTN